MGKPPLLRTVAMGLLGLTTALVAGCDETAPTAPRGVASEYMRFEVAEATTAEALLELVSSISEVGLADQPGTAAREVSGGLRLTATGDGPDAVLVAYEPTTRRDEWPGDPSVARVRLSRAVVRRFGEVVRTATAKLEAYRAAQDGPDGHVPFVLELRAGGAGGQVTLRAVEAGAGLRLVHDVRTAHVAIGGAAHGSPVADEGAWSSVACSIGFHISLGELNYFVDKAYGRLAIDEGGFDGFVLGPPYDWFAVTVEFWDDGRASNVQFDIDLDGLGVVRMAQAPASREMGDLFINSFNSAMGAMEQIEADQPGTSLDFSVPYFYDDTGGGVVQVRVTGTAGEFIVYYDLESPRFAVGDALPVPSPGAGAGGPPPEGGGAETGTGTLEVRFVAPEHVRDADALVDPLKGTIHGAIYRAEDVVATGPRAGTEQLAPVEIAGADLTGADSAATVLIADLPSGDVKVLAFFDVDGNSTPDDRDPDGGDPVTVPLASHPVVAGQTTTATVPFDLVL